jgi:DNA repair exonuclease SbcCD ATPase subunit
MWIRRLSVEHWRGLTFTLEGLAPGLNLIAGRNEAGKSRLVQALRFALFESTKGKSEHKRALATWGVAPEKPRVVVDFTLRGVDWHLEKVFLGTGCNTQLTSAAGSLDGEAAETHLAELLGVGPGKTTELKPEERGLWALLWVDQGSSGEEPRHGAAAQTQILDHLSREIGETAAGTLGQAVLNLANEYYGRFYSIANGKPLKVLTDPEIHVAQLRDRLAAAIARRDALAQTAAALVAIRGREDDLRTRLAAAETRRAGIEARHAAAQELAHRLEIADGEVLLAERMNLQALDRQHAAATLDAEATRLAAELEATGRTLAAQEALRATLQSEVTAAAQTVAAIEARVAQCDAKMTTLRQRERRVRQSTDLARARERLADAEAIDARITELRARLAELPGIEPRDVTALRRAEAERDTARARLDGASASLVLTAHQALAVDGVPLESGAKRQIPIDEDRRIEIDGILAIDVHPGGGEIARLREALHDAGRALAERVSRLGVRDAATADEIARQRGAFAAELQQSSTALDRVAPSGLDELKRQVAELTAMLGPDEGASGGLSAAAPDPAELEAAESEARELAGALREARLEHAATQERLTDVRETCAVLTQRLATDRASLERIASQRAALPDAAALAAAVSDAARTYGERVAARDEARRRFDAAGGESLVVDLEQARQAAKQLADQHQRAVGERIELAAELKAGSNQALHEEVLDLEAELLDSEARLHRLQRDAQAARRLYDVLGSEYRAAQERLTQPVIDRIRPYLADLFPGSEVWIDEQLALKGLRTGQTEEGFADLSGGAREQLSLLVRIGLAEVVGAEEPWPLVLDDVLVNTDAERIRRMQRALFHAGRRMQILLFTCHGELFDGLGPDTWIELPPPSR